MLISNYSIDGSGPMAISDEGLWAVSSDGTQVQMLDRSGQIAQTINPEGDGYPVTCVAVSGETVWVGFSDGVVTAYSAEGIRGRSHDLTC